MSAKINGVSSPPASPPPSGAGQRASVASSPAAGAAGASDSVQITDTASHLITAEQALSEVPVISPGRVARVSDELAAGTYKVSPERIANQLLKFERLLPEEDSVE